MVKLYREAYGLNAYSGILFNHESIFRSNSFVTKKIIQAACNIKLGLQSELIIGNLDIYRDWGWAPEYVECMRLILSLEHSDDFIIATGKPHSLRDFIQIAFEYINLDYNKYIIQNASFMRPLDIKFSCGDSSKAYKILNWQPKFTLEKIIHTMIDHELEMKN